MAVRYKYAVDARVWEDVFKKLLEALGRTVQYLISAMTEPGKDFPPGRVSRP